MLFTVSESLFSVFAHTAFVLGIAVIALKQRRSVDHTMVLPFASIPLIPLGVLLLYAFSTEVFISYYSANKFEADAMSLRLFGPYSIAYWVDLIGVCSTQVFWFPKARRSAVTCFVVGLLNLYP